MPEGPADDRFVHLSDVLPTAWQAVEYAAIPKGGTVVVLGLGPIGDMASRIAQHHGARVLAVDLVVGMEAHGSPTAKFLQTVTALLPDAVGAPLTKKAGIDRLAALLSAIDIVRRGGTISVIGVYGGAADPLPLVTMFDKQIQLRMGQANVLRWVDDIMPLLVDEDPLGVDTFATHHLPLADAPHAYEIFQQKEDGAVKIVLHP